MNNVPKSCLGESVDIDAGENTAYVVDASVQLTEAPHQQIAATRHAHCPPPHAALIAKLLGRQNYAPTNKHTDRVT